MGLRSKPDRTMLRILVIGMFCVTIVTMQSRTVRHTAASDTFTSGQYPGAVDDAWEITVDQNHQILLQFLDFSLHEATSCTVDVLELYNGGQYDNVLVDRFCWGNATVLASTAYVSTGHQLYVRLITAEGYSRKGFRAHYTSVDLQHTNSSGEVTSPGYPNTDVALDEAWRITVNEGRQIRLEFLDFALHTSDLCNIDYFEIYDGASNRYCMQERWCWESFSELPQTVYISSGNTVYLRLRIKYDYPRRGFNASYISVPRDNTLTSGNERFPCGSSKATTLPTLTVSTQTVLNNDISVTATGNLNNRSTSSTITPSRNGLNHSMSTAATDTSINTKATPTSSLTTIQPMTDLIIYIITAVLAMLLIACFFVGFCCCCCYRKKNKTLDAEVPTTTEIQEFGTGKYLENVHESEMSHLKAEANSKSDVFDKTIIATPDDKQMIPIYALPNKGNRQVNGSDDGESISRGHLKAEQNFETINSVQQAGDSSQSSDVMDVVCDAHSDGNKTETKVKHAISSDDKETENAFTQMQAKHEYAYVDRSSVKGVEISNNVIYSLPDEKKNESLEMVPNEAYESFDEGEKESKRDNQVDDIPYSVPFEKEASEGSVMNEAYQSYDTDEDEGNKGSNATYYYLDKNDKEEMGEPIELFYEAV